MLNNIFKSTELLDIIQKTPTNKEKDAMKPVFKFLRDKILLNDTVISVPTETQFKVHKIESTFEPSYLADLNAKLDRINTIKHEFIHILENMKQNKQNIGMKTDLRYISTSFRIFRAIRNSKTMDKLAINTGKPPLKYRMVNPENEPTSIRVIRREK